MHACDLRTDRVVSGRPAAVRLDPTAAAGPAPEMLDGFGFGVGGLPSAAEASVWRNALRWLCHVVARWARCVGRVSGAVARCQTPANGNSHYARRGQSGRPTGAPSRGLLLHDPSAARVNGRRERYTGAAR